MSARAMHIDPTGYAARPISAARLASLTSTRNHAWSKPSEQQCSFELPCATGPVISV